MKPKEIGNKGEKLVVEFLCAKSYTVLQRNYYSRYGEIDIIASKAGIIAFVEVKTRKKGSMVSGLFSVTPVKQKKIIKTALLYLQDNPADLQPRFDVCEVVNENWAYKLEYYEDAFDGDI